MQLSEKQAFVLDSLKIAKDMGMDLDDMLDFAIVVTTDLKPEDPWVKAAAALPLGAAASQAGNVLSSASQWAIPLALAAPPVVGAAAGAALAHAQDLDEGETEELQKKRLLKAFDSNIQKLRHLNRG